jgi:hypothetical protein
MIIIMFVGFCGGDENGHSDSMLADFNSCVFFHCWGNTLCHRMGQYYLCIIGSWQTFNEAVKNSYILSPLL